MKYLLIMLIFLLTGCNKTTLKLENIKSIEYNNINFIDENFNDLKENLLKLEFNCSKENNNNETSLKIVTDNNLYNIYILNDYIEFKENDKYCFCKNKNVEQIYNMLNELESLYNNDSFYTITYTNNYEDNSNDEIIKIDKNDNYIIINSMYDLYNFSINEIKVNNNEYEEIDLIYNKDFINKNNIIIRKDDFTNIKISFSTKYNYIVNIIPYLEDEILKFKKEFVQKK